MPLATGTTLLLSRKLLILDQGWHHLSAMGKETESLQVFDFSHPNRHPRCSVLNLMVKRAEEYVGSL